MSGAGYKSDYELKEKKDTEANTLYQSLTSELWSVFCEYSGEKNIVL